MISNYPTFDRDEIRKKLQKALGDLMKGGTRPEHIAVSMGLGYPTIKNWISGRRTPKIHTIQHLEQLYRIQIL